MKKFSVLLIIVMLLTVVSLSAAEKSDWKEFLKDYEEWVDDYIVLLDKYEKNPADMTLLMEYSTMSTEMLEWTEKLEKMQDDLSPSDLSEYTKTMTRVSEKLNKALY